MAEEKEPISGNNPLASVLEVSNLPSGLKGKAQRIFLRFLAGSLAHPYVRQVREKLDDLDGRSRINMIVAEEIGRQAIADPEFMERAKARLLGETLQKQENLEAVLIAANKKVEETVCEGNASLEDNEPNDDWINSFTREAELASSQELRDRLAGILAGEINRPGSFSRSTIRTIAEMDQETLTKFNDILRFRYADIIVRGEDWDGGKMFALGVELEQASLITGVTGLIGKEIKFNDQGIAMCPADRRVLIINGKPNDKISLSAWLLTKVGQQIAGLLQGDGDATEQLRTVAAHIDKTNITTMYLPKVITDGKEIAPEEQLWPK